MTLGEFLPNTSLFIGALFLTVLIGYPLTQRIETRALSSKFLLGFSAGFAVIGMTGMVADITGGYVFVFQSITSGILVIVSLSSLKRFLKQTKIGHLKENLPVVIFGILASITLLLFFSKIIIWTAGDGAFHASIIRDIAQGRFVPISIDKGAGYAFYPKLFHFYSVFFVSLTGLDIISVMKIIPIIIVTMTSFGVYSLSKEIGLEEMAPALAFMITFAIWKHHYPLMWMGYPQLTAFLFILSVTLSLLVEQKKNIPLLSLFLTVALFFSHQRHFLYVIPVAVWLIVRHRYKLSLKLTFLSYLYTFVGIFFMLWALGNTGIARLPVYVGWLITTPQLQKDQAVLWNVGLLAVFGLVIFALQKDKKFELPAVMLFSWFFMGMLIDSAVFRVQNIGDNRMYAILYIPVSIFSALTIEKAASIIGQKKKFFYIASLNIFLIFSLLLTNAFINTTTTLSWGMSSEDYHAMKSLTGKAGIAINLDPTGQWIYPISGMETINPKPYPMQRYQLLNESEIETILQDPDSDGSVKLLNKLKDEYGDVYLFISSITVKRPGYWIFMERYPKVDIGSFTSRNYEVVYENDGATIVRYIERKSG
jgi:hypothetical protein